LLGECVAACLELDEEQRGAFEHMLLAEPYREIRPMMLTT